MNKKSLLALIGTGISFLMLIHSLAQLDLICVGPVWSNFWYSPPGGLYAQPFQDGFWFRTTVGNAYDFFLSISVASWFVLLISLFSLFYFERLKVKKLEKKFGCLGE